MSKEQCGACKGKGRMRVEPYVGERFVIDCPDCQGLGWQHSPGEAQTAALRKFKSEYGYPGPGKARLEAFTAGWKARDKQERE